MSHVIGAGFPDVEIERYLARQFKLHSRITAPQPVLKGLRKIVQPGYE
jgi:hypothetical protein